MRSGFARTLPAALTLGNLVCGLAAVAATADLLPGADHSAASPLILLAMLFDGADGYAARVTGTASRFGARLDSLADVVSFGVAPALLIVVASCSGSGVWQGIVFAAATGYACCVAVRLARFGDETAKSSRAGFVGLPSPAAAAVIAGFSLLPEAPVTGRLTPLVAATLGGLMVSRLRYPPASAFQLGKRLPPVLTVTAAALLALLLWPLGLCGVAALYAASPLAIRRRPPGT